MQRFRLAAAVLLLLGLIPAAGLHSLPATAASEDLVRVGGADRYATTVLASQQQFANGAAKAVVLANGTTFADALTGGPLAVAVDAPLLLTRAASLTSTVLAEIVRVLPVGRTVYVLGGTSAISGALATSLAAQGYLVERLAGPDRTRTALAIADRLHAIAGSAVLPYYLASSTSFPDALSIAPRAAMQGAPILLTPRQSLPADVLNHLTNNRSTVGTVTVVGGTAAVAQAVQDVVGSSGFTTGRVAGNDRYGTSRAIGDLYVQASPAAPTGVGLASGLTFPDGLTSGPLLARRAWPLLLVKPDLASAGCLTTSDYLQDNAASLAGGFVFGGTQAVSSASETFAEELIAGSRTLNCNSPTLAGCSVLPADNPWNTDISGYPVHANSAAYLASINAGRQFLHADFGSDPTYGIPITVVPQSQALVAMSFDVPSESDPGPYPYPSNAKIEAGSDQHVLVLQQGVCQLYESANSVFNGVGWHTYSGARFDLNSNALRPDYWTSSDAAGLPIAPGLARFDEVTSGAINHALRFTVSQTQRAFIHPATHYASSDTSTNLPPMGLRLRLKASFDTSSFTGQARVVLEALKKYGMFVADNGADWFITGETDSRWDDTDLDQLKTVPGNVFEAVQTGPLIL